VALLPALCRQKVECFIWSEGFPDVALNANRQSLRTCRPPLMPTQDPQPSEVDFVAQGDCLLRSTHGQCGSTETTARTCLCGC
jgi:hypothetical protein